MSRHLGNIPRWFLDEVLIEICATTFPARRPVYSHRSWTITDESVTIRTAKNCYMRRCIVYCWNNPPEIDDTSCVTSVNNIMRKNRYPLFCQSRRAKLLRSCVYHNSARNNEIKLMGDILHYGINFCIFAVILECWNYFFFTIKINFG